MCATASPRHSHHNQFGYARATAVCSSEATAQPEKNPHLQSKPTAGPAVQPSHLVLAAVRTGGRWGKVSRSVWGFPQLGKAAASS